MTTPTKQAIANSRKRFGGPSEKPKAPFRSPTKAGKYELQCRKGHEDVLEARMIAKLYDEPCSVGEFQ